MALSAALSTDPVKWALRETGLEMVLDPARVPADEILGQLLDSGGDDRVVGPQAGLTVADQVPVGVHAHQQAAAGQEAFYAGYLHAGNRGCFRLGQGRGADGTDRSGALQASLGGLSAPGKDDGRGGGGRPAGAHVGGSVPGR